MNNFPVGTAPQLRNRLPKAEGDISSVFVSLSREKRNDIPTRLGDLKREIIGHHGDAILASWKRLLPVVEAKVREANERGPSIFPEVEFLDIEKNRVDDSIIERVKRTGVCIIRNVIPMDEAAELLEDVRKYIKTNPTSKGILSL